jgi:hypothetical protein
MASSTSQVIWIIILLAVSAGAGYLIGRRSPVRSLGGEGLGGANVVYVGPTAKSVMPETVKISLDGKGVVYWMPWLKGQGHKVGITFRKEDFPGDAKGEPPFINGHPNTSQKIQCSGETCFSYAINPALKVLVQNAPSQTLKYKYWQSLDNGPEEDGMIIINP